SDMPFYGEVRSESVYYLTPNQSLRIPAPPTMKNHHNYVASLSQLGRWLAEEAEAVGATLLPETSAVKLLVEHGRVRGVRTLDRVIHTMGWPLRASARYREFGGSFIYPLGNDMVSLGMVVGLDYRDAELSVHDLLQELKLHPLVRGILDGGERVEWGAKTIPEGGFVALPQAFHAPGLLLCGDGVGLVNVPALKGIHSAI